MKLSFVIPDTDAFPSGGNIYNAQLVKALKETGLEVEVIDFEQFNSIFKVRGKTLHFIDTLYLKNLKDDQPLKNCFLIVHHLSSLDDWKANINCETIAKQERGVLECFEGFLASSIFTIEYLRGMGLRNKKYIAIPPALSIHPEPEKKTGGKIEVLMVANLIERKGILPFLKALKKSRIHLEHCQIRIAGSTQLEPDYAQQCLDVVREDKQLSSFVHFEGACSQEQIQRLYQQSNLFISTAFMETFGMALQEAVAHRLPILAITGGNTSYHISEGENGYLFNSIETLVIKLENLSQSQETFKKLAKKAWTFTPYENYSWADAAERLVNSLKL